MSRSSKLLTLALFACTFSAHADSLRLLAPANGATLRGGSFAELRWSAAHLPPGTEEWEGFLSIDGGKYYAFRVTPHLDIDRRRFTFLIPNVDTRNARILIRTGDEVRETHFESRGSFAIVRDPNAEQVMARLLKFGRGEAARDGDPAVLSWADGARNGTAVSQHAATTIPARSLRKRTTIPNDAAELLAPALSWVQAPSVSTPLPAARDDDASTTEQLPITVDLLLLCRRRNI